MIKSSGLLAVNALIFTGNCRLIGVSFTGDIASIITLTVYDNITTTAAATTPIVAYLRASSVTDDKANPTINIMFPKEGLLCSTGLYAALSGTTGKYIIYYEIL